LVERLVSVQEQAGRHLKVTAALPGMGCSGDIYEGYRVARDNTFGHERKGGVSVKTRAAWKSITVLRAMLAPFHRHGERSRPSGEGVAPSRTGSLCSQQDVFTVKCELCVVHPNCLLFVGNFVRIDVCA
jgi:hypothetical protein